jgi:hypothetical protein
MDPELIVLKKDAQTITIEVPAEKALKLPEGFIHVSAAIKDSEGSVVGTKYAVVAEIGNYYQPNKNTEL